MQSIDSTETNTYGMNKDLICKKKGTKCSNIIKQCKNFDFDYFTKEDIKEHPIRILIVEGSGSGKTNALLNLI